MTKRILTPEEVVKLNELKAEVAKMNCYIYDDGKTFHLRRKLQHQTGSTFVGKRPTFEGLEKMIKGMKQ